MTGTERFVRALAGACVAVSDNLPAIQSLWDWRRRLQQVLESSLPAAGALQDDSALAGQVHALQLLSQSLFLQADEQWRALASAQKVAESFDGQLMLLVFGKFNAGKSSLCNFMAAHLALPGEQVRYFHLEDGGLVDTDQGFAEGATETTARLQGVVIGERLVLLDTPGLHSVNDQNAALTLRYTDSADAILWLSSSTSPGQVQELDELVQELKRHKPLLPVITRSDVIDEDEIDGQICKVLVNKTPANRAMQEQDVHARTLAKLAQLGVDVGLLRQPVSLSVHMARDAAPGDSAALAQTGIAALFDALADLAEPALAYKQRKRGEVLLHHLQEQVQAVVAQRLQASLAELQDALRAECMRLQACPAQIGKAVWRNVMPQLPDWVAQHRPYSSDQLQRLSSHLATVLMQALQAELAQQLAAWQADLIPPVMLAFDAADLSPALPHESPDAQEEWLYLRMRDCVQRCLGASAIAPLLERCADRAQALLQDCESLQAQLDAHAQELRQIGEHLRRSDTESG